MPLSFEPKIAGYASASQRNEAIRHMYETERKTMQVVADHFGISRQRVHQICRRAGVRSGGYRIDSESVRNALRNQDVISIARLAVELGNRSAGGVREMLRRTGMYDGTVRLFRFRRAVLAKKKYDEIVAEYKRLSHEAGDRPLSVDELRLTRLNAFRLNKVFGKNYVSKLRIAAGEAARKPRAGNREKKPIEVEQPAPQEAGV